MAHTTLDLSPRNTRRAGAGSTRAAKFRRADMPAEDSQGAGEPTVRRAAYRPREEVAVRRDVVEAFRNRLERDATHTPDAPEVVGAALFGIARAEEALGRFEEARLALKRLANLGEFEPIVWALSRRLHRREGRRGAARDTLKRAYQLAEPAQAVLLKLEELRHDWLSGAPPSEVAVALHILSGDMTLDGGDFTRLWKARMELDALLEQGRGDRVAEVIAERAERLDDQRLADVLRTRGAVWSAVRGELDEATTLLEQLHAREQLGGDLGEFLGSLYFDSNERAAAAKLYDGLATQGKLVPSEALGAAMLQASVAQDLGRADEILSDICEQKPEDWTALRTRQSLLERNFERKAERGEKDAKRQFGAALIDVLNLQLEGPLTSADRVTKLARLGWLYEQSAELEEAAAEVYREALALKPDHLPTLRALGRLYGRRDNWAGLADLYEREIGQMEGAPSVWRRHFQLAELYRVRLENSERALEHYRHVLDARPHYLPALKASASLLGQLGRWRELADLFLASVQVAPNRRQKLYLLDKVAEVAETHLKNYDVALGAWQEILLLDADHPRAFAALGRLYAKTERFEELIALNLREIQLVEDDEELAVLQLKCAEIAERHLEDIERAEKYYRAALEVLPDFLPALEGLGRIYMRNKRWKDIIEMSGRELRETDDPRETVRRLGALAEIFETQLGRQRQAIQLYERMLELEPANTHALESALRLYYTLGEHARVVDLVQRKIERTSDPREYGALQGELAQLAEWEQGDLARAFARYHAALDAAPDNAHWLAGIARTWAESGMSAAQVADLLENHVMKPMDASTRDQYFKVIARLRERATRSCEASRAFRTHGAADSLENQLILELAMARGGEREVLHQFRRANPHHPLERLLEINREGLTVGDVEALKEAIGQLNAEERAMLLAELPVNVSAAFIDAGSPAALRLSAELVQILEGEVLRDGEEPAKADALALRLRAIEARQSHDFDGYVSWTRRELSACTSRDLVVSRLTELAEFAQAHKRYEAGAEFLSEAARTAFPEMRGAAEPVKAELKLDADDSEDITLAPEEGEELSVDSAESGESLTPEIAQSSEIKGEDEPEVLLEGMSQATHEGLGAEASEGYEHKICDGPTLDRLYQAIRDAEGFEGRWVLLRDALDAHAMRDGLTRSRRLYLFRTLAKILEVNLEDFLGASTALSHCWQLSEDPQFLRELVRMSLLLDDLDRAIRFQQRHFEHLSDSASAAQSAECVQSGLWLAELLLRAPDRIDDGIDCLEYLLATYEECEFFEIARRRLAYAYLEHGNPYRAVELFQQILGVRVNAENLADWRTLVGIYRDRLDDPRTAYELQWSLVEAAVSERADLDELVALGFSADTLQDCAKRLEEMADAEGGARSTEQRRQLLGRAAEIAEEELMWPEEAVRLYTRALELGGKKAGAEPGDSTSLELMRRRAFCLAQVAGREAQALDEFRKVVAADPFEPTTYRGMSDLLTRAQAFDRARSANQVLRVLNCAVEAELLPTKTSPSRLIEVEQVAEHLLPDGLDLAMLDALAAAMPLVEKVWADELPQRKALEGVSLNRLNADEALDGLQAAMSAFGFVRVKADGGDAGPMTPQVFSGSTPYVWINREQLERMDAAQSRFVAGYCAALAWSELSPLLVVDGRRVWHLIEAVLLKQTGRGFSERVDVATQELVDQISSPFHAVARRRLHAAVEPIVERFERVHCELWPRLVEEFACRVGMVMAGDVGAAVGGLLGFQGWELGLDAPETQQRLRRHPEVRELVAYSMSDAYLHARYALGLAGRPSQLVS